MSSRRLRGRAGWPEPPDRSRQSWRRGPTKWWEQSKSLPLPPASRSRHPRDVPLRRRHPDSGSAVETWCCVSVFLPVIGLTLPSLPRSLQKSSQWEGRDTIQGAGSHLIAAPERQAHQPETQSAWRPGRRAWRVRGAASPPALQTDGSVCWNPQGFRVLLVIIWLVFRTAPSAQPH